MIDVKQILFDAEIVKLEILDSKNIDYKTYKAFKLNIQMKGKSMDYKIEKSQENGPDKDFLLDAQKKLDKK